MQSACDSGVTVVISSRVIAEGLTGMGLLRGSVDSILESGAHAVFFPHGVGHLIGLDVHDMEGFGDQVSYSSERSRSEQFGTGYLRLDLDLEPGMCFTIEPGIYFDTFGVRTEVNMYVGADEAAVTGPLQTEIAALC